MYGVLVPVVHLGNSIHAVKPRVSFVDKPEKRVLQINFQESGQEKVIRNQTLNNGVTNERWLALFYETKLHGWRYYDVMTTSWVTWQESRVRLAPTVQNITIKGGGYMLF